MHDASPPSVSIDGVTFSHDLSKAELSGALDLIHASRTAVNARTKVLRKSILAGNQIEELEARQWLLKSPEALLNSAVAANKKLRPKYRRSLDACLKTSNLIDFAMPLPEIVPVRFEAKKKKRGWRAIHNHGLHHRTAQDAILRVLSEYFKPKPFQYTQTGIHAAIEATKVAVATGHHFVARLDVKEFYASFDPDDLANELPLPPEVVEHAAVGRQMKVVVEKGRKPKKPNAQALPSPQDLLPLARLGIPTGSGSSPIIGMITLSNLPCAATKGVIVVNYADDFLVLAQSAQLCDDAGKALTETVGDLPGGQFILEKKSAGHLAQGVDFLGHNLKLVQGNIRISPTYANLDDIYKKVNRLETLFGKLTYIPGKENKAAALKCLAETNMLIKGWMAAFSACDEMNTRWAVAFLDNLAEGMNSLGVSPGDLELAAEPWMRFRTSGYSTGH